MKELAVWNCSQLVTLAGPRRPRTGREMRDLRIIRNGAMLIRDGRIEFVGTRSQVECLVSSATDIVDAGGRMVLPGFVDAHTHPVFAGTRANARATESWRRAPPSTTMTGLSRRSR